MAQLPQSPDLLLSRWKSILDPVIAQPLTAANYLPSMVLINGTTIINHKLGRIPQGWFLVDINGAANVYRVGPYTTTTFSLTSTASISASLVVF